MRKVNIQTLIRIVEIKTKPKNTVELACNLTNYYFAHIYQTQTGEDKDLLMKKKEAFVIYILEFLLEPRRRKFKTKKVFREIDKRLYKWKQRKFNKWFTTTKKLDLKDISLKKQSLSL